MNSIKYQSLQPVDYHVEHNTLVEANFCISWRTLSQGHLICSRVVRLSAVPSRD